MPAMPAQSNGSFIRSHCCERWSSIDIHWVKVGFVIDGTAEIDRDGITARDIRGGGPIESLADIGVAAGWRGAASCEFPGAEKRLPQAA